MEIPGSGIINRYIAAQGPLPNTCTDFWQVSADSLRGSQWDVVCFVDIYFDGYLALPVPCLR